MRHRYFTGIAFVALGTLALLQSLGLYHFGLAFWPAVLLWIGLEIVWGSLFDGRHGASVVGAALGLFVAAIGLVKILANAGLPVALSAADLLRLGWPVVLVLLGVSLLLGRRSWHWRW